MFKQPRPIVGGPTSRIVTKYGGSSDSGLSRPLTESLSPRCEHCTAMTLGDRVPTTIKYQRGKMGWLLLWLIGIPVPVLLLLFLLRGCT